MEYLTTRARANIESLFQTTYPSYHIFSTLIADYVLQLALFILAWAALWSFVSGYIYTAGTATEYTLTRTYENDDHVDADIKMVYFKDHVSFLTLWQDWNFQISFIAIISMI